MMMSLSKMTVFLTALFAGMQTTVAIMKPESYIHASAQVVNLNNSQSFMVSTSVDIVNHQVENKLEAEVVSPSASPVMDANASIASFEEEHEIKTAINAAIKSNVFGQNTQAFTNDEFFFVNDAITESAPIRLATAELFHEMHTRTYCHFDTANILDMAAAIVEKFNRKLLKKMAQWLLKPPSLLGLWTLKSVS